MPQRIQRKRTKGWRMPDGAVYVGRGSMWGNPFAVGDYVTPDNALWPYVLRTMPGDNSRLPWSRITMLNTHKLVGRDLVCWCPLDQPCHADFLLEMANGETPA